MTSLSCRCSIQIRFGQRERGAARKNGSSAARSKPSTSIFSASMVCSPASSRMPRSWRTAKSPPTSSRTMCAMARSFRRMTSLALPSKSPTPTSKTPAESRPLSARLWRRRPTQTGLGSMETTRPPGLRKLPRATEYSPMLAPTSTNVPPGAVPALRKSIYSWL